MWRTPPTSSRIEILIGIGVVAGAFLWWLSSFRYRRAIAAEIERWESMQDEQDDGSEGSDG
jgi:hypothetical protein